tara:strand:+ start:193 stop:765 length:573 start_codon:yes stop_codon:yes gene_type:complete
MRAIPEENIPESLWSDNCLKLPPCLERAYRHFINEYNLVALTQPQKDKHSIGGESKEDTLEHFATRYGVSACRLQGILLDPKNALSTIPDDLVNTFSDGRISVLDIACGSGAASISILSTINELRKNNIIPQLPLQIDLTGGDFSPHALIIYEDIVLHLEKDFRSTGIEVSFSPKFLSFNRSRNHLRKVI